MKIKKELLENLLELCKEAHPREVGGLLLGRRVVDDFVIVPGRFYESSIYIWIDRIPIYPSMKGVFHSHPTSNVNPSRADLKLFGEMGREHIIFAYPYDLNSFQAYDSLGKKTKVTLV